MKHFLMIFFAGLLTLGLGGCATSNSSSFESYRSQAEPLEGKAYPKYLNTYCSIAEFDYDNLVLKMVDVADGTAIESDVVSVLDQVITNFDIASKRYSGSSEFIDFKVAVDDLIKSMKIIRVAILEGKEFTEESKALEAKYNLLSLECAQTFQDFIGRERLVG